MMDRATIQLCNMQMGFVEFVVAPLIITFVKILPPLHEIGQTMADNYCSWAEKRVGDQGIVALPTRMKKLASSISYDSL